MAGNFDRKLRLPRIHIRVLLHATDMRHGTNGFTFLPKEDVLRIFFTLKNPSASVGFEPLDHRSRIRAQYNITATAHSTVSVEGYTQLIFSLHLQALFLAQFYGT